MAYRADIEIAIKGAQELKRFSDQIKATSKLVDSLNNYIENIGEGGVVRNINNLRNVVTDAAAAFNKAALQTDEAAIAANNYYQANKQLNNGLRERIKLLQDLRGAEYGALLASLEASKASRAQTGFGAFSAGIEGSIAVQKAVRRNRKRLSRQPKVATEVAPSVLPAYQFPIGPNPRSRRFRFEGDVSPERAEAALLARERKQQLRANQQLFEEERQQLIALDRFRADAAQKQTQRIQALAKTVRGSLSSAAIGGAFPLLFGQSPQAAVGGAIGGLLGGPSGGFAGSLIGTALGEIEAAKARVKELTLELGFSAAQGKVLSDAFELAGRNSQQLEAAVTNMQGLGLSTDETSSALKIAVELSREYNGSVEKIAQAFADTLESGKVSISTLNKFTSQGIPIQDTLAAKLGVSRTKLLEMAKDGAISVQQVTDVLVQMGQEAEKTADKGKTGFDRFTKAVANIASAISSAAGAILQNLVPALDTVLTKLAGIITQATRAINLISDATVGELSTAVFGAGFARGTGFINKGNVDAITQALGNLRPEIATTAEELKKIEIAAGSAKVELGRFGGDLGEYSLKTAQVQLSRVERGIIRRRQELGRPAGPAGIQQITAPVNLPPSGGGKKDRGAAAAEREAERVAKVVREQQLLTLERQRQFEYAEKIFAAEMANDPITARRLQGEQQLTEWALETSKAVKSEQNTNAQLEIVKARIAEKNLIIQKTEQDIAEIAKRQKEQVDQTIAGLENELLIRNATTQAERESLRIAYEMAELRKQGGISEVDLARIQQLKTQLATPLSGGELIKQQIGLASDELAQLTDAGYQVVQAANTIGTAFGESFKGIISGSMTAQEALANFFQSVADHFIDMAAQMIAKWTVLALLNQIVKVFPGGGGGAIPLPGAAPQMTPGAIVTPEGFSGQFGNILAANGAYFNNGIAKFARGGIVNSPTLFKFANGGSMQNGLMGEAGPEAIMPLRRGPDGRLGVEAIGGGSVNVVVNVDATGSNVQGDAAQAKALGSAISVAVQAEIVKQQRPGGLLAGTR